MKKKILIIILILANLLLVLFLISYLGGMNLYRKVNMDEQAVGYQESIINILIMGIDKEGESREAGFGESGGQSDAIFLMVLNPEKEEIEIVSIHRNTMTMIDIYDIHGEFVKQDVAQIALQYGYGNGKEESGERAVAAVSNLLGGIPIHAYVALNMDAIYYLNDAVGGVEVLIEEDMTDDYGSLIEGERVLLSGASAYAYLRSRDITEFDSASNRLDRQLEYLEGFLQKAKEVLPQNPGLVVDLYQILEKYMVTDISIEEILYLVSTYSSYRFSVDNIHSIPGTVVRGEQYEEFHVNQEELEVFIQDMFYE